VGADANSRDLVSEMKEIAGHPVGVRELEK
jgi:hypothetical protein